MRTTVELPSELLRRAKMRAAERGETLKTLLTRAVSVELSRTSAAEPRRPRRVTLPLFGSPEGPPVDVTGEDIARALADEDVARARPGRRRR